MISTALYFGSYNPVHNGHIAIAEWVVSNGFAHELWFVPSPQNPFKATAELAPEESRAEMLELAVNPEFKNRILISRVEFDLPKPSYTINTLNKLSIDFPEREFKLLMGADNLVGIEKWREYQTILKNYEILVYPRPDVCINENLLSLSKKITMLEGTPLFDISSTMVRMQIKRGDSDINELNPRVLSYIKENYLYV